MQTISARKFVWDEANNQLHIAKVIVQCTSIVSLVANGPSIVSTLKREMEAFVVLAGSNFSDVLIPHHLVAYKINEWKFCFQ